MWFHLIPLFILCNVNNVLSAHLGDVTCAVESSTSIADLILLYKACNKKHISSTDILFILQLPAWPWHGVETVHENKQKMGCRIGMFGLSLGDLIIASTVDTEGSIEVIALFSASFLQQSCLGFPCCASLASKWCSSVLSTVFEGVLSPHITHYFLNSVMDGIPVSTKRHLFVV